MDFVGSVADRCCHAGRPKISARKVNGADCDDLWRTVHCSDAPLRANMLLDSDLIVPVDFRTFDAHN